MRRFRDVETLAAKRHGGAAELERLLKVTKPSSAEVIARVPGDRILALMTKRVFYSGFSREIVDRKWADFEEAFFEFDPAACAAIGGDVYDNLLANKSIVRNGAKIASVAKNAQFILDLKTEHGSAAGFFADWPDERYVELVLLIRKRGSRLGGDTGMRFLRDLGKPAFVLTGDVVKALIREGVVSEPPTSRSQLMTVQDAMNRWSRESGRNLTDMSRILAMSVDG